MRRIVVFLTAAGRRLAADGVSFIGSGYARILLLLGATLTAAMAAGLLWHASSARADENCMQNVFCLEKTASPDPVTVGEPLTFTIRGYCSPEGLGCSLGAPQGVTDTLPAGLEFASASATGETQPSPTCSESEGTVTCAPLAYQAGPETDLPYVATIEVVPTRCGTFTNTASLPDFGQSVSETFTVVGCVPRTKAQCKNGGYKEFADLGFRNQGQCVAFVDEREASQ
jgi:hypothetical protein